MRTPDHQSLALSLNLGSVGRGSRRAAILSAVLQIGGGLALAAWCQAHADEVTTVFTYQGVLSGTSGPANGRYDLRFTLFDAADQGRAVAPMMETNALPVTNGFFTLTLDFGDVFNGQSRWLEIAARTNGVGAFVTLPPRQPLTAVPYASYARRAATAATADLAGAVAASGVRTEALAPAAVTADKIAASQVVKSLNGLRDIVTLAAGANVTLATNGNTLTLSTAGGGPTGGWSTTGNAGTAPGPNFLGTTDYQPLEFRVNNQRLLRLQPATNGFGNLIGGADVNTVAPGVFGAVIGGGGEPAWPNSIAGHYGTIAGGKGNEIRAGVDNATIGGGMLNRIEASSSDSVIAGGHLNVIERSSSYSVIGGGQYNTNGYLSVGAVVPGGRNNYAAGLMSFAAGTRAKAITDGDFVWADYTEEDFQATAANQFLVRAHGGVGINTNKPQATLHVAGTVKADQFIGSGAGLTAGTVAAAALAPGAVSQLGTPNGTNPDAVQVTNDGAVGVGTTAPQAGLEIATSLQHPAPLVTFEVANGSLDFTNMAGANCVAVQGNLVAIGASQPGSVTLVDVSPPQPVIQSVLLDGVYVRIPDLSHPDPLPLPLGYVRGVALDGNRLAVTAAGDDAVCLFSVADPQQPTVTAILKDGRPGFNSLRAPSAVVLSGNLLVIASAGDDAVTFVNLADASRPQPMAVLAQGVNGYNHLLAPASLALSGSLLAIASPQSSAVTLVDVSVPASPVKLAEIVPDGDVNNPLSAVALEGPLLAFGASAAGAATLVDVSEPRQPKTKAVLGYGEGGARYLWCGPSLALHGRRLFVGSACADSVSLFDISDPGQPRFVNQALQGVGGAHYLDRVAGLASVGDQLAVVAGGASAFTLLTWWNQPVSVVSRAWVGVGTDHPVAALDVLGNVVVQEAERVNLNANRLELGEGNRAAGTDTVAMGRENASTGYGSVAGGYGAQAGGKAAVALGDHTTASADGAVALGSRAQALHPGSFVWADNTPGVFSSTGNNQFLVRATGGIGINRANPATALDVNGTVTATVFQGDGSGLTHLSSARLTAPLTIFPGPTPSAVAHINNGGYARGMAIAGQYGYLANDNDGLRIYDITNPANPVNVGHANDGGSAYDVAVVGDDCYLANLEGLRVYDVSDRSAPLSVGYVELERGGLYGVAVAGGYCYLANGVEGLRIFSLSNPANPVEVAHIQNGDPSRGALASGLAVVGNYCYLGNYQDGLRVYDISTPSRPVNVGHVADGTWLEARAHGVVVAGNYCYLANLGDGLRVYDVSDPATPVNVAHIVSADVLDVSVAGDYCCLADGQLGLRLFDISQPANPVEVGGAKDGGTPNRVATAGNYCYLGNHDDGLRVYALVGGGVQAPVVRAGLVQAKAVQSSDVQVTGSGPAEARLASTAAGAGDWSLGTGWTGAGRPSFYLFDNVASTTRLTVNESGNVGIGTTSPSARLHVVGDVTVVGNVAASGTISPSSDRNAKTDVAPVAPDAILDRLTALPIQQWRFKSEANQVKHLGPMAQDFRQAFGLGEVPTAIATVDADGVALAAIQGLNRKLEEQLRQKEAEIQDLKRRLEALEARDAPQAAK